MKNDVGRKIQTVISFATYYLSGFLIISPLHKSDNILVSLISGFIVSVILIKLILRFFSRSSATKNNHAVTEKVASVFAVFSAIFVCLILLTEIIKDVSYIANRGISLPYYLFIAVFILFVSYYLCISSKNGIYRFLILSAVIFLLLITVMFFSLFSVRSVIVNTFEIKNPSVSAVTNGIKAGIFFTLDSVIFLFCFKEQTAFSKKEITLSKLLTGFIISFIYISVYSIFTSLIFGRLTPEISDPDYALIKLIPSIDLTEIISAVRIISFLIKSSCYIFLCADCFKSAFPKAKLSHKALITIFYISIPIAVFILAIFDKTLKYGAFQHLIFPINAAMSLCFLTLFTLFQKKN